jgi:phosphatidylglycerophosphate synthase
MADTRGLSLDEARRLGQGSAHLDADPTYARRLIRRISPYVSWFVATRTGLSADAITTLSIVSGIAGGLLVAGDVAGSAAPIVNLAAVVLLQLAYLLDVADGEVARIRGTAGRRGTYLDLIGHFVQNRALFAGASLSLIQFANGATWAIVVGLLVMAFSAPFGLYAFQHVTAGAARAEHPDHAPRIASTRPANGSPLAWASWLYRRLSFVWNYPASMNFFCAALVVDAIRAAAGAGPQAIPILIVVFGVSLAVKQIAHALRLLRPALW